MCNINKNLIDKANPPQQLRFKNHETSTIVRSQALSGQWNPIKHLNDAHVIDIATYAVAEIEVPSHKDFKLKSISSGETKTLIDEVGTCYHLKIVAGNYNHVDFYDVAVLENLKYKFRSLVYDELKPRRH